MAHDQLATACGLLGRLSHTLKPSQLMLVIKANIRPLIQLNVAAGLNIATATSRTPDLPHNQAERIELMIVPDPEASRLKKEKINSPTRLLVSTYAFKTLNRFGNGTTQRRMQEGYQVTAKQLVACITRRKYLGGMDKKSPCQRSVKLRTMNPSHPHQPSKSHHLVQTKSQPGEWWVAVGRGANYPINLAKTPITHCISSLTLTQHLIFIFITVYFILLQVSTSTLYQYRRQQNRIQILHLLATTHSRLSLLFH